MFFTSSEKKLSALPDSKLRAMYEHTEMLLNQAAKSGKVKNVKKAMRRLRMRLNDTLFNS